MEGRRSAALLVDWENLRRGLNEANYWQADDIIIKHVIDLARVRANEFEANVTYMAAFAPSAVFDAGSGGRLKNAEPQLHIITTLAGKNAADTELILRASDLRHQGITHFIVVSSDVDFVPLAVYLEREGCVCELWAISERRVRREVVGYDRTSYLDGMLSFSPMPRPRPTEVETLTLQAARLVSTGFGLWSYPRTISELVDRFGDPQSAIEQRWSQATSEGHLIEQDVVEFGKNNRRKRLAYEAPVVSRLLANADAILHGTGKLVRHRKAIEIGDLLAPVLCPGIADQRRAMILESLQAAGFILSIGEVYRLARPGDHFGTVGSLIRLACVIELLRAERGWTVVSGRFVDSRWENFHKPGGNLDDTDRRNSAQEAQGMLASARAACMMSQAEDGRGHRGWGLVAAHPLTVRAIETLRKVAAGLTGFADGAVMSQVDFEGLLPRAEQANRELWLEIFAALGLVRWISRRDEVTIKRIKVAGALANRR